MNKTGFGRFVLKRLMMVLLLLLLCSTVYADDTESRCRIAVEGTNSTSSAKINVQVSIALNNEEFQEHQLYLAYHFYDPKGELVLQEWERIPLTQWVNGEIRYLPVSIDLTVIEQVSRQKELEIRFDIADLTDNRWFSEHPSIQLDTSSVYYHNSQMMRLMESLTSAVHRPAALVVNIFIFAGAVFLFFRARKEFSTGKRRDHNS